MIKNKDLLEIWESYDAYYIGNKYGDGTHNEQFNRLHDILKDEQSEKALCWIGCYYDCYYKNEYEQLDDSNPFYFLQRKLDELGK